MLGRDSRPNGIIKITITAGIYHVPQKIYLFVYSRTMVCSLSGPTETMAMGVSNSSSRKAM